MRALVCRRSKALLAKERTGQPEAASLPSGPQLRPSSWEVISSHLQVSRGRAGLGLPAGPRSSPSEVVVVLADTPRSPWEHLLPHLLSLAEPSARRGRCHSGDRRDRGVWSQGPAEQEGRRTCGEEGHRALATSCSARTAIIFPYQPRSPVFWARENHTHVLSRSRSLALSLPLSLSLSLSLSLIYSLIHSHFIPQHHDTILHPFLHVVNFFFLVLIFSKKKATRK